MSRLYKRGKLWYADYTDRDGKRVRRPTKMKDKQLAAKVLAKWETEEGLVSVGMRPRTEDASTLKELLTRYTSSLKTSGRSSQHIDRTIQLIESVADHNHWKLLGEIDADGLNKYGQHLLKDAEHAARTVGSMITAVRSFCRWCVRNGALAADPTASVSKPSIKSDRRLERRMVLPAEWVWIKQALATDIVRNGQKNCERLLMYRVAIETGLRSSELRSLSRSSLKLDGDDPHVIVKAGLTKNAELAKQYVSDGLAQSLKLHCGSKKPNAPVFNVTSRQEMARTLRADIADARLLWLQTDEGKKEHESDFLKSPNSQGETIDFHALRHTCGAWLVLKGVTLAEVREIMRHSTITLTIDCYGHLAPDARSRSRHVLGNLL